MRTHSPSVLLRTLALVSVLGHVAFAFAYRKLGVGVADIGTISHRYENLFTPAPRAFAIWAVIYAALVVYALSALRPSQSRIAVHDRIAPPFIAANVAMTGWIATFAENRPLLALAFMVLTLASAIVMYRRMTLALSIGPEHRAWLVPFSLLLSWISVATIGNVTMAFVARGASPKILVLAVLALGLAVALGLAMAARFRDLVFPAVIAWACLALAGHAVGLSPLFVAAAMAGAFVSLVASGLLAMLRLEQMFGLGVPLLPQPTPAT